MPSAAKRREKRRNGWEMPDGNDVIYMYMIAKQKNSDEVAVLVVQGKVAACEREKADITVLWF